MCVRVRVRKRVESLAITPGLRLCGVVIKRKRLMRKDDHQLLGHIHLEEAMKKSSLNGRWAGRYMGVNFGKRDLV